MKTKVFAAAAFWFALASNVSAGTGITSGFGLEAPVLSDSLQAAKRWPTAARVIKTTFLSMPRDFVEIGKAPAYNWKKTAIVGGGLLGLIALDKPLTLFIHKKLEPALDFYKLPYPFPITTKLPFLRGVNGYLTIGLAGLYGGAVAANWEGGQRAVGNTAKSVAYSYLVSHLVLKTIFARHRPNRPLDAAANQVVYPFTQNNWDFFNFHKPYFRTSPYGTAMPSFHFTAYFAAARVLQMETGNWWIPYTACSLLMLSDFQSHNHWFSDMAAGIVVGTTIGTAVVKASRILREKKGTMWSRLPKGTLNPYVGNGGGGFSLKVGL